MPRIHVQPLIHTESDLFRIVGIAPAQLQHPLGGIVQAQVAEDPEGDLPLARAGPLRLVNPPVNRRRRSRQPMKRGRPNRFSRRPG